jgi:hypothetical protein
MSHYRMSAKRVVHESTGGTLASLPKPVDPVGNTPDRLTLQTVAPLQRAVHFEPPLLSAAVDIT